MVVNLGQMISIFLGSPLLVFKTTFLICASKRVSSSTNIIISLAWSHSRIVGKSWSLKMGCCVSYVWLMEMVKSIPSFVNLIVMLKLVNRLLLSWNLWLIFCIRSGFERRSKFLFFLSSVTIWALGANGWFSSGFGTFTSGWGLQIRIVSYESNWLGVVFVFLFKHFYI